MVLLGLLTPDGRRIAFASSEDDASAIYVMNADGSDVTQLTDHATYDMSPSWSPDGQQIAFASLEIEDEGTSAIYVMNADGSNMRQLADNTVFAGWSLALSWSPDGRQIAFVSLDDVDTSATSSIYLMNADGSNVRKIADYTVFVGLGLPLSWSPDGQQIVFVSVGDTERSTSDPSAITSSGISVMNADGSNVRKIADDSDFASFYSSLAWAPAAGSSAPAPTDDHGDSPSDATSISDGSTLDGNIHISSDVDYFSFRAERGVRYTMATTLVSSYDTAMSLYASDGSLIEEDSRSDYGSTSRIQWVAPDSSTYYVAVRVGIGYTGAYQLSLSSPQTASPPGPPRAGIAFSSNRGGTYDIYVMNPDGSDVTQLTNDLMAFDPEWSPDGRQIVFSSRDSWSGNYNVYVMNADGSGVTRLTDSTESDWDPSWSPDGQQVAFASERDGNENIYVMNTDGSGVTRLTDNYMRNYNPSWSPDGRQIAFQSRALSGASQIYVMNADGSDVTLLTNQDRLVGNPVWSPDGRQIAFNDANFSGTPISRIYVMNADGSDMTQLTSSDGDNSSPSWSPDGRQILFRSTRDGDSEIYVMNADGSDVTLLTYHPARDIDPSWSPAEWTATTSVPAVTADDHGNSPSNATPIAPDSSLDGNIETIADVDFFSFRTEALARYTIELRPLTNDDVGVFLYDSSGSRIEEDDDRITFYAPSGSRIARDEDATHSAVMIEWAAHKSDTYYIAVHGGDTTGTYEISLSASLSALSAPLRGQIVFISRKGAGEYEEYVMNADGSGVTLLTDRSISSRDLWRQGWWTPDGRPDVFSSPDIDENYSIYMRDADGVGVTRITDTLGNDRDPSWSPDGQWIAFNSDRGRQSGMYANREVFVMNADGSEMTQITNQPGDRHGVYGTPSWSPDGQRIAFSSANEKGNHDIYVVNADGSDMKRITGQPADHNAPSWDDYDPSWSPDGRLITFSSTRDWGRTYREIYVMNADGSGVTRITYREGDDSRPIWIPDSGVGSTP